MDAFRALVVDKADDGVRVAVQQWEDDRLMPGDVTIRVEFSSINYKDALAVRADGRVARTYPLVPGIDLAGSVLESADPRLSPGQPVLAHGYDLGVSHHGGFAELARVPARWVVPLPEGLDARQAMAIGTAGFTAAMSVEALEHQGLRPGMGVVLVSGASGGVGSMAIDILSRRGYQVAASTGSRDAHDFLRKLGADEILDRAEVSAPSDRPLDKQRWAGAVDAVGGSTLAYILRSLSYGGSVAASGNVGGGELETTVYPFILRAVNLLGIESSAVPIADRIRLWQRLGSDLRPPHLDDLVEREVTLDSLPAALEQVHRGQVRGRALVRLHGAG